MRAGNSLPLTSTLEKLPNHCTHSTKRRIIRQPPLAASIRGGFAMLSALLAGAVLLAADPESPLPAGPDDLASYRAASAKVGRDPDAHVKLALWCEARGLQAERLKHLAIAVLTDPKHATARGLLGLVAYRGRWERPDAVGEKVRADAELAAALAEYNALREAAPKT